MLMLVAGALVAWLAAPPWAAGVIARPPVARQAQEDPAGHPHVRFVWRDHPSIRAGSALRVDFQGKLQWDRRRAGDNPAQFEAAELHRARVGIDGTAFRHIEFSVERELTNRESEPSPLSYGSPSSAWKDAYVELNYSNAARVRFGKFKVPFGLDQLTGVANLDFVQRSLAGTYLAPGRDTGAMVHGRFFRRRLQYWAGIFRQDGENARSSKVEGGDATGAGRMTAQPFRGRKGAALEDLQIGSAFASSKLSDASPLPNGLRGRTTMSRFVFFAPVFVDGTRRRFEVDGDWPVGPVGIRAEYTDVRDSRQGQGLAGATLPPARARAAYLSGSLVVTGERKTRPVKPDAEFGRGGIGAVELVGRIERMWFDSTETTLDSFRNPRAETILPSGDRIVTFGLNWYANRWSKLQFQGSRERLDDNERSPVADGAAFWNALLRLQLTL
jgi:phosphate-selective porin OprO/OprP